MSELYCIRHGQASFGSDNYDVLSPTGVTQSGLLAAHVYSTGARFDAVYSGTLERQRYSASAFMEYFAARGCPIPEPVILPGLDEYDSRSILTALIPGMVSEDPALKADVDALFTSRKSFQRVFERAMLRWIGGGHDCGGIESWGEFQRRVAASLELIMTANPSGKTVVAFTSGGTISAAVRYAIGVGDADTMRLCWQIVNSSVTRFKYSAGRIALSSFNNFSHLETWDNGALITYR